MSEPIGCLLAHTENASSPHKPRASSVHVASRNASAQQAHAAMRARRCVITRAMIALAMLEFTTASCLSLRHNEPS